MTQASQESKKQKPNFKYLRDKNREKVKGVFNFFEVPGGSMSFVYREFKEDPVERFDLVDGEIYTLPLGVAKHLNKSGWYPVHMHAQDESGKVSMKVGQKVRRFGFRSLEFIDIDELNDHQGKQILTVETV